MLIHIVHETANRYINTIIISRFVMIKPEIIKGLYKKYPLPINEKNQLDLKHLSSEKLNHHLIEITTTDLIINSVEKISPFHEIPLRNISGIENLESHIAIVLRNSIIFLDKKTTDIHVHINIERPSIWQRMKYMLKKDY